MNNRWKWILPLAVVLFLMSGCARKSSETDISKNEDPLEYAFTLLADPQIVGETSTAVFEENLNYYKDSRFAVVAGDMVNNTDEKWEYEMIQEAIVKSGQNVYCVPGNHDDPELFAAYFYPSDMIRSGTDYSFAVGSVLYLCLDSNNLEFGARRSWMKAQIDASDYDWVIVVMHHSIFSPLQSLDYDASERCALFSAWFQDLDIDLVLSGDDHVYARTYLMHGVQAVKDGPEDTVTKAYGSTLYLTAGSSSGSKFYEAPAHKPGYTLLCWDQTITATQVRVTQDALTIITEDTETKKEIDRFVLKREQQRRLQHGALAEAEQQILASIIDTGAISVYRVNNEENWINPYFADYAAMALLRTGHAEEAKAWIRWHFQHLNPSESDEYGIAYTICDYKVSIEDGGVSRTNSEHRYDSVDSYAASFLLLLDEYVKTTKDRSLIMEYRDFIGGVIQTMRRMKEGNLTIAHPGQKVCYLMDNCEVYKALKSAVSLIDIIYAEDKKENWLTLRKYCQGDASSLKEGIEQLWSDAGRRYNYAVTLAESTDGDTLSHADWDQFYPDAIAQMAPVIYGVLAPGSPRCAGLYKTFCEAWKWEILQTDADSPWGMALAAANLMGDEERCDAYYSHYEAYMQGHERESANLSEHAWVVLIKTGGL